METEIKNTNQHGIHLSGRGWGDYSPVVWTGDISKSNAEIIAECRSLLDTATDVDNMLTDEGIMCKINIYRHKISQQAQKNQADDADLAALKNKANETGQSQMVRRWTTASCHNGHDDQCSCDVATKTIDGMGNIRTTYHCQF